MLVEHVLNTVGLAVGIAGGVIIYYKGFPQPEFGPTTMGLVESTEEKAAAHERRRRHFRVSRFGVALLIAGFTVQVIATWV